MFQMTLLIISFLVVHTIQGIAFGPVTKSRVDRFRTVYTQENRHASNQQTDPRRQTINNSTINSLTIETKNGKVDSTNAKSKDANLDITASVNDGLLASNAGPDIPLGNMLEVSGNSTNLDAVRGSKADYAQDAIGAIDRNTEIPTNDPQRNFQQKNVEETRRVVTVGNKRIAREVQTAINATEMSLNTETRNNLSVPGSQENSLSTKALEDIERLAKQNSSLNISE